MLLESIEEQNSPRSEIEKNDEGPPTLSQEHSQISRITLPAIVAAASLQVITFINTIYVGNFNDQD